MQMQKASDDSHSLYVCTCRFRKRHRRCLCCLIRCIYILHTCIEGRVAACDALFNTCSHPCRSNINTPSLSLHLVPKLMVSLLFKTLINWDENLLEIINLYNFVLFICILCNNKHFWNSWNRLLPGGRTAPRPLSITFAFFF